MKRSTLSRTNLDFTNTLITEQLKVYDINLNELANSLDDSKWKDLAIELNFTNDEISTFENNSQFASNKERVYEMLNYWKANKTEKSNDYDDNLKLQQALININFDLNKLSDLIKSRNRVELSSSIVDFPKEELKQEEIAVEVDETPIAVIPVTAAPANISFEDRDITKESESVETSDADENKSLFLNLF